MIIQYLQNEVPGKGLWQIVHEKNISSPTNNPGWNENNYNGDQDLESEDWFKVVDQSPLMLTIRGAQKIKNQGLLKNIDKIKPYIK